MIAKEFMVVSKKDRWKCKLYMRNAKIKQMQKFNDMNNVITINRIYKIEIQRQTRIVKVTFQKW